MEEKTTKKYTPSISYNGKKMPFKDMPLNVTGTKAYKCENCKKPISIEHIEKTLHDTKCLSSEQISLLNEILPYINKYRDKHKLDTCLRKAHFIAQIGAEMEFNRKKITEGTSYYHSALSQFSKFKGEQEIDDTILNSLKKHLNKIFKVTNKDGETLPKTNEQLKVILKNNKVIVNDKELYGRRDRVSDKEKILKTINKKVISGGKEIEIIDYNIVLLKHLQSFGLETLSRAYADKNKNGSELLRGGYMYRGRGLKQITWKTNYIAFSKYRENNPFEVGEQPIDFSEITDAANYKGNFDLLAENMKYAVQSALWYYQKGNSLFDEGRNKYSVDWADEDNIEWTSRTLNGGHNGKKNRRDNTFRARKVFKVYEHYKLAYENGSNAEKKAIEKQLGEISKVRKVSNTGTGKIDLKDPEAEKLYNELRKVKALKLESIGIKKIPFIIEAPTLKTFILKPIISGKKKRRRR